MLRNYLKTALRHIKKQKASSNLNIFVLMIGIACTILITLFINDELSYDRFHENIDSIYRILTRFHNPDGSVEDQLGYVHVAHGPALKDYFPEIKRYVRIFPRTIIVKRAHLIESQEITLVDNGFFEMFSFPLIQGNPTKVLSDLTSIVITESYAKKYFGGKDPVGESLTLLLDNYQNNFIVSGVAKDPPPNSTITFELLINFESFRLFGRAEILVSWNSLWDQCSTFIELRDKTQVNTVESSYPDFARIVYAARFARERDSQFKNADKNIDPLSFGLQRMKDVHLDPHASGSKNLTSIYILGGIAWIILFIAGINFITLAIGNSSSRFVEVGMRKVFGAERRQLISQFWTESMILTGLAFLLGVVTAGLLLPAFNRLALKSIQNSVVFSPQVLGLLIAITFIFGLFVGCYPALVLSRSHPVDIFKGRMRLRGKNYLTRFLMILQFALSIVLIISTITLARQVNFMVNQNLGYNKEGIMVVRNIGGSEPVFERLKNRLSSNPEIKGISGANSLPVDRHFWMESIKYQNKSIGVFYNRIDENYFDIINLEVLQGRNFSREMSTDHQAVIVNETLAKQLKVDDPIGKTIELYGSVFPIIGVVNDYHMRAKREEILPAIHLLDPSHNFPFMMIRFSPSDTSKVLAVTRSVWKELQPDKPLVYSFLDEDVAAQYVQEKRWERIVGSSSVTAVLIACLGVFGLTSISISRRIKEIGIRKVCGASIFHIIKMLALESAGWVLIANLIAWPTAAYTMHRWLQRFAYKIHLSPYIFILSAIVMLMIVLLTTCVQTWKTAKSNPVDALRNE